MASPTTSPAAPPPEIPARLSPPPVRHRRQLRNYIIDKSLQLRYIGVVTILSAVICGTLGYLVWYQRSYASQTIIKALTATEWIDPELKMEITRELHGSDIGVIITMVGVCVGLIVVLSLFLTVLTHKVAGPLHKVSTYLDKLRAGKLPEVYDLRRGDEFQDFFKKFKGMNEALRARARDDADAFGRFVEACERAGVPSAGELGHGLSELRQLEQEKREAIR